MIIEGKKIVLFGGTSGIGLSCLKLLSGKNASQIISISRNPERCSFKASNVIYKKIDVLDENQLSLFFDEVGSFDILINTATGGERAIGPFEEMDLNGYRNSFRKLWGYTNTVRLGLKNINSKGCIVLVSGSPAKKCKPGMIALASVGGAVEAFAKSLAAEIKPIRINVVSPGVIDTPMVSLQGKDRNDLYSNLTKDNLIPRAGKAEEVSHAISFAIENEFITGTIIDVDGGWLSS